MSEDTEKKLIETLRKTNDLLAFNQSDYCDTKEAARIIGLTNERYLTQLYNKNLLIRYPRGNGYVYKKTECYAIAGKLDNRSVVLETLKKQDKAA